jgi:hypothetical protein
MNALALADSALAKEVREASHEIVVAIMEYFCSEQREINEIITVPLTIIARIVRTNDAIQLLLKEGHPSEAAVLALTEFELRLDLAYVAHDVKHAAAWLDHENTRWSLITVGDKLTTLFDDKVERAKLEKIFRFLSGIKHGNPVFSELGFPARIEGRTVQVSTGEISDKFSKEFTNLIFAYSTYQLAWSSQVINVYTGQYAKIDVALRLKVRDLARKLHPVEQTLSDFLTAVIDGRSGHFGMKRWKRAKDS